MKVGVDMGDEDLKDQSRTRQVRKRLDFVARVVADKGDGVFEMIFEPNPRRYVWVTSKGERLLYDKMDNEYISEDALRSLAAGMDGTPIMLQPPAIASASEYVRSRKWSIRKFLRGTHPAAVPVDCSAQFLDTLEDTTLEFACMSVDLVGSTQLASTLKPEAYARVMQVALFELSRVVPRFHGHVLKYTGDGLIAYFPSPSFTIKNDLALDCALTSRLLTYEGINPALVERGLPPLGLRIGLDSGEAYVVPIGSPEVKQHKDIIGLVVNLAAKIQGIATEGGVALGESMLRMLHTGWREICEEVVLPDNWLYKDPEENPYKVYRVTGPIFPSSLVPRPNRGSDS